MTLFMIDNSDGSESIERRPEGLSVRGMIGSHKAVSLNFFMTFGAIISPKNLCLLLGEKRPFINLSTFGSVSETDTLGAPWCHH
jgi:hypothetical protein